jgi:hypothetical protein
MGEVSIAMSQSSPRENLMRNPLIAAASTPKSLPPSLVTSVRVSPYILARKK